MSNEETVFYKDEVDTASFLTYISQLERSIQDVGACILSLERDMGMVSMLRSFVDSDEIPDSSASVLLVLNQLRGLEQELLMHRGTVTSLEEYRRSYDEAYH